MAFLDAEQGVEADDPHIKVSRLPALPKPLDPIVAGLFENTRKRGGHILNLHKVSGHAPKLTSAKRPFTYALRNDCDVPRLYRELAICRSAINVVSWIAVVAENEPSFVEPRLTFEYA